MVPAVSGRPCESTDQLVPAVMPDVAISEPDVMRLPVPSLPLTIVPVPLSVIGVVTERNRLSRMTVAEAGVPPDAIRIPAPVPRMCFRLSSRSSPRRWRSKPRVSLL